MYSIWLVTSEVDRQAFCSIKKKRSQIGCKFLEYLINLTLLITLPLDCIFMAKYLSIFFPIICIIEVYLLKNYFEYHFIYKWRYYKQTIFNQLNDNLIAIIGLCHSVAILWKIYVMWHNFHFKRMLINRIWFILLIY